ncbi:MAG: prepilin-type N-terminal cleavage/methylation domain-containing protein [Planctomycetota bacterium]
MNKRTQGFTLIELMIVVAIIAIIAAIAIPSLLNARMSGNEASAISSLRTLTTVNEQYRTRFGEYAPDLPDLEAENYIDSILGAANPSTKSGYDFAYARPTATTDWEVAATPVDVGTTGERGFFVDESGVIRFSADGTAPDETNDPLD